MLVTLDRLARILHTHILRLRGSATHTCIHEKRSCCLSHVTHKMRTLRALVAAYVRHIGTSQLDDRWSLEHLLKQSLQEQQPPPWCTSPAALLSKSFVRFLYLTPEILVCLSVYVFVSIGRSQKQLQSLCIFLLKALDQKGTFFFTPY